MPSQKNIPLIVGIGVLVLAMGALLVTQVLRAVPEAPWTEGTAGLASTTDTTVAFPPAAAISKKKTLAPEQPFVLPLGATAVDEYAFIQNDTVYFRSLTGKTPLAIPNSNAGSFKRLGDFVMYPGSDVVSECGAAPVYTYYGDEKQVYFYQVWRAPTFRSSQIEVIIGAQTENFKIIDVRTTTDGGRLFEVGYKKATTTCMLSLSRTTL